MTAADNKIIIPLLFLKLYERDDYEKLENDGIHVVGTLWPLRF